jgi:ketosteroid isomerase-like protein
MTQDIDAVATAHRLFDALAEGDRAGVLAAVTDDAVVWQNYDAREKPFSSRIDNLIRASQVTEGFHYAERRYETVGDGAVLQHRLRGQVPGGEAFDAPIAVRMHMRGDRIARFEEYLDQGTLAPLYAAMNG